MAQLKDLIVNGKSRFLDNVNVTGTVTATALVKSGGTAGQLLRADGSTTTSIAYAATSSTAGYANSALTASYVTNPPSINVTVTGSGDAIVSATASGHTITLSKGGSFATSGHNHDTTYSKLGTGNVVSGITGTFTTNGLTLTVSKTTIPTTDTTYSAGTDLTLSGTTFNHKNSGVTANTYGSATQSAVITVNATGHITSATVSTIAKGTYAETSLSLTTHGTGNAITSVSVSNHKIDVSLGTFATSNTTYSVVTTGSGNAVTTVGLSGTTITATLGATFLTTISKNVTYSGTLTSGQVAIYDGTAGVIKSSGYTLGTSVPSTAVFTDTKNTVGATTLSGTKLLLTGVKGTASNTQSYVNSSVYIGTDNKLYSAGEVVLVNNDLQNIKTRQDAVSIDISANLNEVINHHGQLLDMLILKLQVGLNIKVELMLIPV